MLPVHFFIALPTNRTVGTTVTNCNCNRAIYVTSSCRSGDSEGQGGPPNHGQGGPPDHAGGPPNHEGQGGPPDHAGGPPNHEGQGGPPDHAGGPPNHEGGPPNHEGGPPNHEQHGGDHEGMGGGSMMNEGPGNERGPPPACTSEQTQSGLEVGCNVVLEGVSVGGHLLFAVPMPVCVHYRTVDDF